MKTIFFIIISLFTLSCSKIKRPKLECYNLRKIDSSEYYNNKVYPKAFKKNHNLRKINHEIKIPNQKIVFKDDFSDENFVEFSVEGAVNNWLLIKEQNYNQDYYFLISNNEIDTLLGKPHFFSTKVLSIEDSHTDSQETIEIWDIQNDHKLKLYQKFSLKNCKSLIEDSYLLKNYLFMKTKNKLQKPEYFKIKYE
jgi:hypothetical protein